MLHGKIFDILIFQLVYFCFYNVIYYNKEKRLYSPWYMGSTEKPCKSSIIFFIYLANMASSTCNKQELCYNRIIVIF